MLVNVASSCLIRSTRSGTATDARVRAAAPDALNRERVRAGRAGLIGFPGEEPRRDEQYDDGESDQDRHRRKDGGRAVLPFGALDEQMLIEVKRIGDEFESTDICPCRFVKLIGDEGWKSE